MQLSSFRLLLKHLLASSQLLNFREVPHHHNRHFSHSKQTTLILPYLRHQLTPRTNLILVLTRGKTRLMWPRASEAKTKVMPSSIIPNLLVAASKVATKPITNNLGKIKDKGMMIHKVRWYLCLRPSKLQAKAHSIITALPSFNNSRQQDTCKPGRSSRHKSNLHSHS